MFYVYAWYDLDNNEIFYVGKGCKNRYKNMSRRNELFKAYINTHNCDVKILKKFDNEKDALLYEHEIILELKADGQARCNLDYGGTGGTQFIWTNEMRQYKSKYNPMKKDLQRNRMSQNNPMKREDVANKVSNKLCKPVVIGTKEFLSVTKAAQYFNVKQSTIIKWCKKGINPNHELCRYKDAEQIQFKGKRYNKGGCRPLIYINKWYETPLDLAKELGLHNSTVAKWAKKGFDTKGNICRYVDDTAHYEYKPFENGKSLKKPIIVNGVLYASKSKAEKELGLCKGYLAPYIAGTRKNNNYICEYVNQQPSRENVDKSISEGSTTNK